MITSDDAEATLTRLRLRPGAGLAVLRWWRPALVLGVLGACVLGFRLYSASQHAVIVEVAGRRIAYRTHQRDAAGVLRELALPLHSADEIDAPRGDVLLSGEPIRIRLAHVVRLVHDGSAQTVWTLAHDMAGVLESADVALLPGDALRLADEHVNLDTAVPWPGVDVRASTRERINAWRQPVRITVTRSVPLRVHDEAIPLQFRTTGRTVGEALFEQGIMLYAGDETFPGLDAPVTSDLVVYIQRTKSVAVQADGVLRQARTRAATVQEVLAEQSLSLGPQDYITPPLTTTLGADTRITIVRVYDEDYIEETPIPYGSRWEANPNMEIDLRDVADWGHEGARRKQVRVHYEDGRETHRTEEAEWVARKPQDRIYQYGTKIVLRTLDTPEGTLTYWRKVRMLATSYTAATSGKERSHPEYGITRTGMTARRGLVAIDPTVIGFYQEVYVPGYGKGLTADTGGAIKGRRIDLCYNEDDLVLWYRWVDVYLLAPAPPPNRINYQLPNTPKERA